MKHQPFENYVLVEGAIVAQPANRPDPEPTTAYFLVKRFVDVAVSLLLLPVLFVSAIVLLFVNPRRNKGPLFFVQTRMGQDCEPFQAIKFRSMTVADEIARGVNDPLETDRITPLGNWLRRTRIDELPQVLNVLKGDMSLIGPRPDYFEHAKVLVDTIPGYRERHNVIPGISGYAQTEVGYADSSELIRDKVKADAHYIENRSVALEAWIFWRTILTVVSRKGA